LPTDAERVAVLETKLDELGRDVRELATEERRTRKRLHDLEGIAGALVDLNRQRSREAHRRQRRIEWWLRIIATFVAVAAFVEPLVYRAIGLGN